MDYGNQWDQQMPPGRRRQTKPQRSGPGCLTIIGRLFSFAAFTTLTVGLFVGVMGFLSPDVASRIQAFAPELSKVLPAPEEVEAAPTPEIPGVEVPKAAAPAVKEAAKGQKMPTPGWEASSKPIGVPPVISNPSSSYELLLEDTAYDPCRPIHYVIQDKNMPAGGENLIHQAVASVSDATGLVFVNDGATNEPSSAARRAFQPERYGDRWAPLLFIWKTGQEQSAFDGSPGGKTTLGIGGSVSYTINDEASVYVTGEIQLNAGDLTETMGERGGPARVRSVIQHELAHVVGLGHIDDASQLMADTTSDDVTDFAAGDLTGLARLGAGECVPEL